MKIAINQKTLLESLEKGAVAAISDTAQEDSSIMSPIIKSIKITVGIVDTVHSIQTSGVIDGHTVDDK